MLSPILLTEFGIVIEIKLENTPEKIVHSSENVVEFKPNDKK